jgi:hypothetical protein
MRRLLATLAALSLVTVPLGATTVIPPTFEQLVASAEIVFEGEVLDTRSRIENERDGRVIVTAVQFRVAKVLKGTVGTTTTLEFLGGTVDDLTYRIEGLPVFTKGDRDVIFAVTSQRLISPLVGISHGRVRIVRDPATNADLVRRFDGTPLRSLSAMASTEQQPVFSTVPALSLSAFEGAIAAEVAQNRRVK